MADTFLVTKSSGDQVEFDIEKFNRSLRRIGANEEDIVSVITELRKLPRENGMTTRQIYNLAFSVLKKIRPPLAGKYKIKEAIFELGPSGYPFESFVGELLRYQGYQVEVGKIVKGFSVNHEVDVVAIKDKKTFMVECKFHSSNNRKSDVKVPLYIDSRFRDIKREMDKEGDTLHFDEGWIITNTRFTSDALDYGNCYGIRMISWDNPKRGSLKDRINISGLYPVTCIISLKKREKKLILDRGLVLAKQLLETPDLLTELKIGDYRRKKILKELEELTQT